MKACLALLLAALLAALAFAGCGGGSSSSGTDPASVVPPGSPVFVEATVRPEGELKSDLDGLAKSIAGVEDLGELIVSKLEQAASDSGEEVDFATEVEPWLGAKAGLFLDRYDGEDFGEYGIAVQTTDAAATQAFVDKQAKSDRGPADEESYEGVDYRVERDDGMAVGVFDELLVFAEDARTFKAMVDASGGESLRDEDTFASAISEAADGSAADVFVDVGGLIDEAGGKIDPEAQQFLDSAGIDPEEATAVASLVPGTDQIEVDLSSDLGIESTGSGDASSLLGSLPAESVAAVAAPEFGKRLGEAIDQIDAKGIPGKVPPGRFKSGLKQAGIDVEKLAAAIGDLGVFATGTSKVSLAGAAVLRTDDASAATNTVANVGLLLRGSGVPGVTAISGGLSGFSVHSADLGPKPLVVAAKGERIAIAYGVPAAQAALATGSGQTLADDPVYEEAIDSLGATPISGFVDGPAALKLASALVPAGEQGFREAKPYLEKIDFLAIGGGSEGERETAKLIAGIGK